MTQGAIRLIQARTAQIFEFDLADFLSDQRTADLAHARQGAMLVSRKRTPYSLTVIARHFRRDHTTILHGIRAAQCRRVNDESFDAKLVEVENSLSECGLADPNTEAAAEVLFHKLRSDIDGVVAEKFEQLRDEVFGALQGNPELIRKILNRKV